MNAVICIVLASVSLITVKTIKRIPLNLFYRTHSDGKHYTEGLRETDNQNRRALNLIDMNGKNTSKNNEAHLKFTDFILEAAKTLKTYENRFLEEAFVVIDNAVWENMYNGCKSHELGEIRRYVTDLLGSLKDASADMLRQHLDSVIDAIQKEDYGDMADMMNFVNSLYVGESEKFIEVLLALVHKRISAGVDLSDILKYALKYIVFDHYCALDNVVRRELIKMIKHYWRQFKSLSLNTMDRNINALPLVTPFVYDKNKVVIKKRRFNTVNGGRLQPMRNNEHYPESSDEHENSRAVRRAGGAAPPITKQNSSAEEADYDKINTSSTEWESTNESMPIQNDHIRTNKTVDENVGSENDLTSTKKNEDENFVKEVSNTVSIKKLDTNGHRTNQMPNLEEPKRSVLQSTRLAPVYANNTIDRLIKIGDLAKQIQNMIGSNNKMLRQGADWLSLNSLLDMDYLGIINGGMPTTPQMISEMDGKKDILISMKAKYQE